MTRDEAKKLLPIIQAFAEGKEVQYFTGSGWETTSIPSFDLVVQWRIKPEPKEIWVNEYESGIIKMLGHPTKELADCSANQSVSRKAVRYREVLE